MRTRLLCFCVTAILATIIGVALASFVLGSRHLAATPRDPFIGRTMPCGDVYRGERRDINGLLYFLCEKGHPWPQMNRGGLLDAQPAPVAVPPPPIAQVDPARFHRLLPPDPKPQLDPAGRVGRRP